eukprot:1111647-Amphidinium_carterae.1
MWLTNLLLAAANLPLCMHETHQMPQISSPKLVHDQRALTDSVFLARILNQDKEEHKVMKVHHRMQLQINQPPSSNGIACNPATAAGPPGLAW